MIFSGTVSTRATVALATMLPLLSFLVMRQDVILKATMTGAATVPNPGPPDGKGTAALTLKTAGGELCYELTATGMAPATAAHIHKAPLGENGPPVVTMDPPATGSSTGCVQVEQAVLADIAATPGNYYVNLHNPDFPRGAIRGQLGKEAR